MVEYGNAIGNGPAGDVGGSHGSGGTMDLGAQATQAFADAVHTVQTMPPLELAILVVLVVAGLFLLKRAF